MFERFTVKARQTVFFARYAASQLGGQQIEAEHLLLGVLRADIDLATRLFGTAKRLEEIRERIEKERPAGEPVSTSIDLPVSNESKRVLTYGAEEAALLHHDHIGPEHLLLGLLRLEESFATQVLRENGITAARLREEANRQAGEISGTPPPPAPPPPPMPGPPTRDLTDAARQGSLDPLVGREREMDLMIAILVRRTRKCPALVGESGVGKSAIIAGLAQLIAADRAPEFLQGQSLLSVDVAQLTGKRGRAVESLQGLAGPNTILCIENLFHSSEADAVVLPLLVRGAWVIGTGTDEGFRRSALAQYFHPVEVFPLSETETLTVLKGVKDRYEKFHRIPIRDDVIPAVLRAARQFPTRGQLLERALDVMDEAGARAKLRRGHAATPEDVEAVMIARTGAAKVVVQGALMDRLERNKRAVMAIHEGADVRHVIAEGDLVVLHYAERAGIFRLDEAGAIVERWDVPQPPGPSKP